MHHFTATCAPGLEDALAGELAELGLRTQRPGRGVVAFEGRLADGYRACLWSRVASRVLLQLKEIYAADARSLYTGVRSIDWSEHIGPDDTLAVSFVGTSTHVRSARFGALKVKDAIVDRLRNDLGRRPSVDRDVPDLRVNVHLARSRAHVSIDLSGEPLHLRGHDRDGGRVPLKETLAAGILRYAGWPALAAQGAPLVDPCCGSGTFLMEAAGMLRHEAPGLSRERWGFTGWRGHEPETWARLVREAKERVTPLEEVRIHGADVDAEQIRRARRNLGRAGILDEVSVRRAPLQGAEPPASALTEPPFGLVVTNPPYGERIGGGEDLERVWAALGDVLRRRFLGWTAYVLAGSPEPVKHMALRPSRKRPVFHGAMEARLLEIPISTTPVQRDQ